MILVNTDSYWHSQFCRYIPPIVFLYGGPVSGSATTCKGDGPRLIYLDFQPNEDETGERIIGYN